jgi:uncharacterized protein (TIGR03086 family)
MTEQVDLLAGVMDKTGQIVERVSESQFGQATPCPDWTVEQLLDHVAGWARVFAAAAEGGTPQPPEPVPAKEAAAVFAAAAERIVAAFRAGAAERPLTMMSSELPGAAVLGMVVMEYVAHGWDLAVATGQPVPHSDAEARAALDAAHTMLRPEYRGPDSIGEPVEVPEDAPALDRFLGFVGRDPGWSRST